MGLLRKACRRLLRLSRRNHRCKTVETRERYVDTFRARGGSEACSEPMQTPLKCTAMLEAELAEIAMEHGSALGLSSGCFARGPVVNVTRLSREMEADGLHGADLGMLPSAATTRRVSDPCVCILSSESDSGVCLGEGELVHELDVDECACDDDVSSWSDSSECECDECTFARCEDILEDWHISAKDMTLDKVLSSQQGERVYSGYWHGSVTVHQRQSTQQAILNFHIREAHMLSKIRHENVQLFLGVCLDLGPDSVATVMSDMKGDSLHSLLHKEGHEFPFTAMTKYLNQIAQGMAYLHDRGIAHPLLTSKCVSIHYRVCISMLSPAFCTNSVDPSQLVYLPPEVIRTLHSTQPQSSSHHCNSLSTDAANQDSTDANIFSFGTIVYEMVTTKRPFPATPGELIIWNVGNGRCQSLHHMNAGKLRDVVQSCWSHDPELRPSFKELLCTFEHNMSPRACGLNAYFSFSDPGRLAKTGLH